MIEFWTKQWYQNEVSKSILQKELIEEAIALRQQNGKIAVGEIEMYGDILASSKRNVEYKQDDLKRYKENLENKQ
ncbi:MAG: hypothetical protein RSC44_02490 [Clostridia bacterium]